MLFDVVTLAQWAPTSAGQDGDRRFVQRRPDTIGKAPRESVPGGEGGEGGGGKVKTANHGDSEHRCSSPLSAPGSGLATPGHGAAQPRRPTFPGWAHSFRLVCVLAARLFPLCSPARIVLFRQPALLATPTSLVPCYPAHPFHGVT